MTEMDVAADDADASDFDAGGTAAQDVRTISEAERVSRFFIHYMFTSNTFFEPLNVRSKCSRNPLCPSKIVGCCNVKYTVAFQYFGLKPFVSMQISIGSGDL